MRIAYVGSRHPLSNYGGIERALASMLPLLAQRGHQITVFAPTERASEPELPRYWSGVESVHVPALKGKHTQTLSSTAVGVAQALRRNFELVHFTHEAPGIFVPVVRAGRVSTVVSICGLDWQRSKWNAIAQRAIRGAERIAVPRADGIVALSRGIQCYVADTYHRKAHYVPNGMVVKACPPWSGRLERFKLKPYSYVAFAARLVPEKGCHVLINAWNRLRTSKILAIAGTGRPDDPYPHELRSSAERDRIVFTGHLDGQDLEEFFSYAYLFVLPSFLEGQSVALLEALGRGRATLVSDIAENTTVLDGNGFTFRVGDAASLHEMLEELLQQPQLVRDMEQRVADARHGYPSWDEVAAMHENIYCECLANSRGQRRSRSNARRQGKGGVRPDGRC
jgi:glycosyltransferase involved in cell wall biosynthesis